MSRGLKRDLCLKICGISKHQFYDKPKKGSKRGCKPSKTTLQLLEGKEVHRPNSVVIISIKTVLQNPKSQYGYRRMTQELHLQGYLINHKKVYRLMKSKGLLQPKKIRSEKTYVRYRVVAPESPLRLIEMDIKQVFVLGKGRYAYILTILDVFTRVVLDWSVGFSMKQKAVQGAWQRVIDNWLQPLQVLTRQVDIEVRSDNGPQFCAGDLRDFLKENYFLQTFTHPYTPQENGHIESFHAILGDNLKGKDFAGLADLEEDLSEFYRFYNFNRIHSSTCGLPPALFYNQWEKGQVERIVLDEKGRKVKFRLKVPRNTLRKFEPKVSAAGIVNQREVLSLIFEGSIPDKIILNHELKNKVDGAVPTSQPAV